MKSDEIFLSKDTSSLSKILDEVEKAAAYSSVDKKSTLRLRLLAEELVEMLPSLLEFTNGKFWIENEGKEFELHTTLIPDEKLDFLLRDRLLEISKSGKNAAAKGILSKIKLAATFMMIDSEETVGFTEPFYDTGLITKDYTYSTVWSLQTYREKERAKKDENWDELEKSIIANLADDVLVGLQGDQVDIIVKKTVES